jgi:hypothetical protein
MASSAPISTSTPVALGLLIVLLSTAFWLGSELTRIQERQSDMGRALEKLVQIVERHEQQIYSIRPAQ